MIALAPPLRLAEPADGPVLAELVNFAGEGLPLYVWGTMAAPGQDAWEIGRERLARKAAEGQVIVIDEGRGPVTGLTGYPIPAMPGPIPDDMPALFRPLQELENLAPASWYVNILACYPAERGRGLGTKLLGLAESMAMAEGLKAMSLIVADTNAGARRLYERVGYREWARRLTVREGWETPTREWVLMTKDITGRG
ncbi:MAG TPA: GNAT family N-acetyltransferase [Paracoccaceae bacterium]|nr:GNAT family N-acetyltransferase [Paracoccaceae bacterium]